MAWIKNIPILKIVIALALALVLIGILVVSIVVAMKWISIDISWNQKIPPGQIEQEPQKLSPSDQTDRVHAIVQPYYEEALGTLKAATRTEIAARVLAPIQRINVRAGQHVNKDDVLIVLDDRAFKTGLSKAQSDLLSAKASREQAENNYRRQAALVKKQVVSKEEYDEALAAVGVARAKLAYAEEALAEAEVMLSYTVIKAPKSGVIVDRLAEEGDMARPGEPLLILYDPMSLRLEVPVMENLAVKLHPGDQLNVRIDALEKTEMVKAVVDEIVPQAQATSRSFLVKVALPRSPNLFEGMSGRLQVPAGTRRFLCLNAEAIERNGQNERVYVVHDDGTLERRLIKTGRVGRRDEKTGRPTRVEVLSGLEADEKVLLRRSPNMESQ